MSALDDIAYERRRQIESEGWSAAHDDSHDDGEMARAAASYALAGAGFSPKVFSVDLCERIWPWSWEWWKIARKTRRQRLIVAAALLVAEIERLDRLPSSDLSRIANKSDREMGIMSEYLLLKWGTLKGWELKSDKARDIMQRYIDAGMSMSAMAQHDTPEQKTLICDLIDAIDGEITNDWSGEKMTKEEAKKYVTEYRSAR